MFFVVADDPLIEEEQEEQEEDDDETFGDDDDMDKDDEEEEEEDEGGLSWRHIGLDDGHLDGVEEDMLQREGGEGEGGDDDSWWRCEAEPDQDDDTTVATTDIPERTDSHHNQNHQSDHENEVGKELNDLVTNRHDIDRMLDEKRTSLQLVDGLLLSPERTKLKQLADKGLSGQDYAGPQQGGVSEGQGPFSEGKDDGGSSGASSPCSRSGTSPCTPIEMIESMHRTEKVAQIPSLVRYCTIPLLI